MSPIKIVVNVLDDQEYILDLIKGMFDGLDGYEVSYFDRADEFTSAVNKDTDLVISDVRVGEGYDALTAIKNINDQSPSTYIIVMSAYFDVPFMQKMIRLRINDTVVKTEHPDWVLDLKDAISILHKRLYNRAELKQLLQNR